MDNDSFIEKLKWLVENTDTVCCLLYKRLTEIHCKGSVGERKRFAI